MSLNLRADAWDVLELDLGVGGKEEERESRSGLVRSWEV